MTCVCIELQYQTAIIYRRLSIWNFWIISVKMSVLINWADGIGGTSDMCNSLFSVL